MFQVEISLVVGRLPHSETSFYNIFRIYETEYGRLILFLGIPLYNIVYKNQLLLNEQLLASHTDYPHTMDILHRTKPH